MMQLSIWILLNVAKNWCLQKKNVHFTICEEIIVGDITGNPQANDGETANL